ncbi:MAG: hypothetical protein ACI4EV_08630 [Lachnospiraceae bacterium]
MGNGKRLCKIAMLTVGVLIIAVGLGIFVKNINAAEPKTADNALYQYPIYPGTDEWASYDDVREKNKLLQLPEEVLSSTTSDLVKIVMEYPYLSDIFVFNSYRGGFNAVVNGFNGLKELIGREDAAKELLAYYEKIDFGEKVNTADARQVTKASNYNALEVILAQPEVYNSFDESQKEKLESLIKRNVVYRKMNRADVFALNCDAFDDARKDPNGK